MAAHLTRSVCEGFQESSGMDGTDGMLWNSSEKDGNVRSEHEEDGNSLIGKDRENLTCLLY
jgi:hypothetical protein